MDYAGLNARTCDANGSVMATKMNDCNEVPKQGTNGDSLLALFTNGPGLAEPLIMHKAGGADLYYHADALGSIVALTDNNGNVVETYSYQAFGRPTIKDGSGNAISVSAVGNPFMYAGTEYDPETGFYHMGFRYLDPDTGRWTQEDPIGFGGGEANLYSYVHNSPIRYIDPLGLVDIVVGLAGSLNGIAGVQGGKGVYIPSSNPKSWGTFSNQGGGVGWNVGGEVGFGMVGNAEGCALDVSFQMGWWDLSLFLDPNILYRMPRVGDFQGFFFGFGPSLTPYGTSIGTSHTTKTQRGKRRL
jgi:RHS repeat-associated protein